MPADPSRSATLGRAARHVVRAGLGVFMIVAGVGHLVATEAFLAQTPPWLPARELIVYASGVVEVALGLALLAWRRRRREVGWALAAFYVVVFPGNVSQLLTGTDAFGLDSDLARAVRLLLQPVLIALALWSTGAWPRRGAARR
ncbi:MAG: hypothetical protein R6T85_11490 [Egibacteraceae bacterium]